MQIQSEKTPQKEIETIVKIVRKKAEKIENPFTNVYLQKFLKSVKDYKEIVIVGAGTYGELLYQILQKEKVERVVCFADNNKKNQKKRISGKEVLSVDAAVSQYPSAVFIVTPKLYFMELIRQLVDLKIDLGQIECFLGESVGAVFY